MNKSNSISVEKAADLLGISVEELQQLSTSGKIKSHRTAFSGHLRLFLEDLQSMYKKRHQSPALLAELENN